MNILKIRSQIRKCILDSLSKISNPKYGVHILNGHYIGEKDIDSDVFYDLLNKLKCSVDFIDFDEAAKFIRHNQIPPKVKLVAFSFDDGFAECYTKIKPVLDHYKIKAGFFINPNFIDGDAAYIRKFQQEVVFVDQHKGPMTWDEVKILANEGHIIGAHSMDHVRLNVSDLNLLKYQMGECKIVIERNLKIDCDYFAYPYGRLKDISQEAIDLANKLFYFNFTQDNYRKYFSFEGKFINRRHFECNWPVGHVRYFLAKKK